MQFYLLLCDFQCLSMEELYTSQFPGTMQAQTICSGQWHLSRRKWHPTPVLLPGKSHGQRSLVGCSPWGRWGSGATARLHFHFSLSCIGEGNGNPLQCSCLENPRDEGAWWAAVYGVAQSQTQLKWLSSSSTNMPAVSRAIGGIDYFCLVSFPLLYRTYKNSMV